ncbi:MAG: ribonuclease P protein component [Hyphomicrobiaceae bacterium]|nr:ribonuclease P protein component [Hyphomicrobiaceae bacterium]
MTLKTRAEFLAVRGGARCAMPAFVLETKLRASPTRGGMASNPGSAGSADPLAEAPTGPRFGFTITKKIGNAVVRNRIRRRLKAALTPLSAQLAAATHDYVVIARQPAFDIPFATLQKDLERALQRVHHAGAARDGRRAARVT